MSGEDASVNENEMPTAAFEAHRERLRALALRLLGSRHDADEAVQEAWLRLSRTDPRTIDSLGAWLTTVTGRICLDILRARQTHPEVAVEELPEPREPAPDRSPEDEAMHADSVGLALMVVLEALDPAERLAFVLHDLFAVPFEEIALIVDRTPVAARKLASRARRRVQADRGAPGGDAETQRAVVDAFLQAARDGDFAALLRLLDPEVILRADANAVATAQDRPGAPALEPEVRGADAVMRVFAGRAKAARPALIEGLAGAVFAPGGSPYAVFDFIVRGGRVTSIELLSDPEALAELDLDF
jgi:RNA polymerase sigma factor (sigma-70 family)